MLALVLALASCPQTGQQVQEPPTTDWNAIDQEIDTLFDELQSPEHALKFGGFLRFSWSYSHDVATAGQNLDTNVFSVNGVRLHLTSEQADWKIHIGLRGETDSGQGFFGDPGGVGTERAFSVLISRELYDELGPLRDGTAGIGRFTPPFLGSAMVQDNRLLFVNRTFNGERWDFYDHGLIGTTRIGPLRGWAAAQNGRFDRAGDAVAYTLRGMWDVVGGGVGYENEGALGAPEGLAVSFGGAAYFDTTDNDASTQALEAHVTIAGLALSGEMVDNGDGLGDLFSWESTASYLIMDDLEIGARYSKYARDDESDMRRFVLNKYLSGHDMKLQLDYTDASSHAPRADVEVIQVGFVVSF